MYMMIDVDIYVDVVIVMLVVRNLVMGKLVRMYIMLNELFDMNCDM
jgi:hypothetical protein